MGGSSTHHSVRYSLPHSFTKFTKSAAVHREPEAAAVHCARLTSLPHLKPSQNFIICDAGGATVVRVCVGMDFPTAVNFSPQDLAVYKIMGELQDLEIAELCARSGANCGSTLLFVLMKSTIATKTHTVTSGICDSSSSFKDFSPIIPSTLTLQAFHASCTPLAVRISLLTSVRARTVGISPHGSQERILDPVSRQT